MLFANLKVAFKRTSRHAWNFDCDLLAEKNWRHICR